MSRPGEDLLVARTHINWDRLGEPDTCSAIRPNDNTDFIPVRPFEQEWAEPGITVVQYRDNDGQMWGSLTTLEPKTGTPSLQIDSAAGGFYEYYENYYPLQGTGTLDVWYRGRGWLLGGKRHDMHETPAGEPVHVLRGDTFRLHAGEVGMMVLAIYPEVPTEDAYHTAVPTPAMPIMTLHMAENY
jgi:hypothetical protein